MRGDDPNREYLLVVADAIGDLCNEVVFVGGSVAGLLLTDPIADGIRATKDVDAVVEATTLSQYHQIEKHLSVSGFKRDASSEVICRWRHTGTGVLFDLMPTDPAVLGFSNRWFHNPRLSDCLVDGFESARWKLSRNWLLMNRWGTE